MRFWGFIFIFLLTACWSNQAPIRIHKVEVEPFTWVDNREKILVQIPRMRDPIEFNMMADIYPSTLKELGFLEVWDSAEHELELISAGVRDYSLERNIRRLYDELGVYYLLDITLVKRQLYDDGYYELERWTPLLDGYYTETAYRGYETDHTLYLRYTLYRTDLAVKMAELEVQSYHKHNNRLIPNQFKREIKELFNQIYLTDPR
jgi:hypothetical protein